MKSTLERRSVARHEVGHALAARACGLRVDHLRVWSPLFSSGYRGRCRIVGPTVDGEQWAIDAYAVYLHAGLVAEREFLFGQDERHATRIAIQGAAHDMAEWQVFRDLSTLTDDEAYHAAVEVVHDQWDRLDALADELATRGRLAGHRI